MADDDKTSVSREVKDSSPTISLGDNSYLQLTPVKLESTNYLVRSRSFQLAITACAMSGSIKRVSKAPKEYGPARKKWHKECSCHDLARLLYTLQY